MKYETKYETFIRCFLNKDLEKLTFLTAVRIAITNGAGFANTFVSFLLIAVDALGILVANPGLLVAGCHVAC